MSNIKGAFFLDNNEVIALQEVRHNNPHHILGMHECIDDLYINVYYPGAVSVSAIDVFTNNKYELVSTEFEGFYSIKILDKKTFPYKLIIDMGNDNIKEIFDPYSFNPIIDAIDIYKFNEGNYLDSYQKIGSHVMTVNGVNGTLFTFCSQDAKRVSVIGNFNNWDGRINPMRKLDCSSVYELFIPNVEAGEIYKYEITSSSDEIIVQSDPYSNEYEVRPNNASKVTKINYNWTDIDWTKQIINKKEDNISIYEVHLGSWKKPDDGREFYNYREIAKLLASYVKKMGYNYIELMPIMEHLRDESLGYDITGYFAPTSRYGSVNDFAYFIDYMHKNGIGVIIDWVPFTFDYNNKEYKNFLISNVLFWVDKFHVDGIKIDISESIDFIKELNMTVKNKYPNTLMIAKASTVCPKITSNVEDGGLGFDLVWNKGYINDLINYMSIHPNYRKENHNLLTQSMIYNYNENFILPISHEDVVDSKKSILAKMPGGYEDKYSNLRLLYGFMMTYPGKKLLFMGQEIGQNSEFDVLGQVDWSCFEFDANIYLQKYMQDLNKFYLKSNALSVLDYSKDGFKWISYDDNDKCIISFVRAGNKKDDSLVIVCNFSLNQYDDYMLGVPTQGKWSEVFTSNNEKYSGDNIINKGIKVSKKGDGHGMKNYINVVCPPLSITIFKKR